MKLGSQTMRMHTLDRCYVYIVDELVAIGEDRKEVLVVARIQGSLPEEYDSLVTALEKRPKSELTIDTVRGSFMNVSGHRRSDDGYTVTLAYAKLIWKKLLNTLEASPFHTRPQAKFSILRN